ncbi:acetolactate synthase small subunit [Salinisphaera sp. USBA-960]|nr:acetolactate synthase small subunit [Salifodinibacter halophilus]NNC25469.1 acetolactate synthase small subunit [Salifodinibacter halophilus]
MANESGALVRVAGMFAQRGFNIENLNVAPTDNDAMSRLTLVTRGSEAVVDQIVRQTQKLVDVIDVQNMTAVDHTELEVALVKIRSDIDQENLNTVLGEVDVHSVDTTDDRRMLRFLGTGDELTALIEQLGDARMLEEHVRSGAVTLARGAELLHKTNDRSIDKTIVE